MFIGGSGCLLILTTRYKSHENDNIQWLIVMNTFLNNTLKVVKNAWAVLLDRKHVAK